jgi:hypothetical protein
MKKFWLEKNCIVEGGICSTADGVDTTGMPLFEDSAEYAAMVAIEAQALVELAWGEGEEMLVVVT